MKPTQAKQTHAPRNRSTLLSPKDIQTFSQNLITLTKPETISHILNTTICQDNLKALEYLPSSCVDLLFLDPPYNLNKTFNGQVFKAMDSDAYEVWLNGWLSKAVRLLRVNASIYICGDWRSSGAIFNAAKQYFIPQNRITFERDKGRGAQKNWKNACEDIWFFTKSKDYYFNVDAVKIKRKVIAPYRNDEGKAKDWQQENDAKYRLTHPSNIWSDITIPFWSMPENTQHPTQKPEKLLAKIILASSKPKDVVLDPFLGSGTTSVVAKKLNRQFIGIEIDKSYACLAEKRLRMANDNKTIQGYQDGIFWERNTAFGQMKRKG